VRYAYDWLTDYRAEDRRFSRLRPRYTILRLSEGRVVRIRTHRVDGGDVLVAVDVIRLSPPNRWHVDQIDEDDYNSADFHLTRLGPNGTRVEVLVLERWMTARYPSYTELRERLNLYWDRIVAALEKDFQAGRPARA